MYTWHKINQKENKAMDYSFESMLISWYYAELAIVNAATDEGDKPEFLRDYVSTVFWRFLRKFLNFPK